MLRAAVSRHLSGTLHARELSPEPVSDRIAGEGALSSVADRYGCDRARDSSAPEEDATGAQVAWALRCAGCDIRLIDPDHVAVYRTGAEVLRLPIGATLRPSMLRVIARAAGIAPDKLQALVSDPEPQANH